MGDISSEGANIPTLQSRASAFGAGVAGGTPAPKRGIGDWGRSMIGGTLYGPHPEPTAPLAATGRGPARAEPQPPSSTLGPLAGARPQIGLDEGTQQAAQERLASLKSRQEATYARPAGPTGPPLSQGQRAMQFLKGAPNSPSVLRGAHGATAAYQAGKSLQHSPSIGSVFNYAMGYHLHNLTTPFGRHMVLSGMAEDQPRPSLLKAKRVRSTQPVHARWPL